MNSKLVCQAIDAVICLETDLQVALIHIAAAADKRGCYGDGQPELSRRTGIKERSLKAVLKALEEAGYIRRDMRHRKDGRRRADLITLTLDKVHGVHFVKGPQGASAALGQGAGNALGQGAPAAPPVKYYSKASKSAAAFPSQDGASEAAENDTIGLRVIHGGKAA